MQEQNFPAENAMHLKCKQALKPFYSYFFILRGIIIDNYHLSGIFIYITFRKFGFTIIGHATSQKDYAVVVQI